MKTDNKKTITILGLQRSYIQNFFRYKISLKEDIILKKLTRDRNMAKV